MSWGSRASGLRIALIIFAAFAVYLIGNGSVSLVDRDEPRYAQTSRQMLESGDWVVPRHYDKVRTAKPVFIYWCQAAAMRLLGDNAFAARLPSALAMPLTLMLLGAGVWRWAGRRRAVWSVFVLATSVLVIVVAKASTTDSVLLLWITLAQGCLYLIWRGRATWPVVLTFGIAIGLAGLTKGPVVLGVLGMTLLALGAMRLLQRPARRKLNHGDTEARRADIQRAEIRRAEIRRAEIPKNGRNKISSPCLRASVFTRARANGLLKGAACILVIAAVTGPWLYLLQQRAPRFVDQAIWHDVWTRIFSPLEGHFGPPGYHLATIWGTYLPWSILLPMAIVFAWRRRRLPQIRFALAAVLGPWVMFEIVQTKLPHYMLPVFPFLAFLTADAIVRCLRGQHNDLVRRQMVIAVGIWAIILAAMGWLPLAGLIWFDEPRWTGIVLGIFAVLYTGGVFLAFKTRRPAVGTGIMGFGMLCVFVLVWTIYLPRADYLRLSKRVAHELTARGATGPGEVIMLDYKEPSLAFYQGGSIRENSAMALTDQLLDQAPRWLVITRDVWNNSRTTQSARERVQVVATVEGLAYADGGRRVEVMILAQKKTLPVRHVIGRGPKRMQGDTSS